MAYVTQRQVAEKAGVHQTTVSLVFRNHPSVPAVTRERVFAAARELGYRRHPLLAALMSARLRVVGVERAATLAFLTDFETRDGWRRSPTAMEMFTGARRRARQLGYRLETFWLGDPRVRPARLGGILRARGIQGVLVAPFARPLGFETFDFSRFTAVALSVSADTAGLLGVAHAHFEGMRLALQKCVEAGRRRVGVVLAAPANRIVRDKWLAAHALESGRRDGVVRLPAWTEATYDEAAWSAWLDRWRPDVLVGTFWEHLPATLGKSGRRVPEDVGLVALSVGAKDPFFAGVYQRSELLGARSVDVLVGALNRNEQGLLEMRQVLEIEGEWRGGPSLVSRT